MARAVGIDVSVYDRELDPTSRVDFVIMRVSYGTPDKKTYPDANFKKYYPKSLKKSIRGGYHYMSSHGTWQNQANAYLSLTNDKELHFNVCDLESAYNTLSANYVEMCLNWMEYVQSVTKRISVLYTNTSTYNQYVAKYFKDEAAKYPFWIAQYYNKDVDFQLANPRLPNERSDWAIWQCIPGEWGVYGYEFGVGRKGVDVDVFNGNFNEMLAWANATPESPSPSEPPIIVNPTEYTVTVGTLNIRSAPMILGSRMGQLYRGDKFQLFSTQKDNSGNIWGKIADNRFIALKYNSGYLTTWTEGAIVSPSEGVTDPPPTDPTEYAVSVFILNVRTKPDEHSSNVGKMPRGAKFFLLSTEKDSHGNIWGKIKEHQYIALKFKGQYYTTWKG